MHSPELTGHCQGTIWAQAQQSRKIPAFNLTVQRSLIESEVFGLLRCERDR